jgi:hypothetical protein
MPSETDYIKMETGKTWEELTQSPSFEDHLARAEAEVTTKQDLRILGYSLNTNKSVFITEEQRPHIHVIGSTQEGKSKFVERLIRGDIKRGIGLCLIDPTAGGRTAYDILKYCCYKNIRKVCLIDPSHAYEKYYKVPGLQPFLYTADGRKSDKLRSLSVQDLTDTMRVLFNIKDPGDTARLERFMPPIFNILYDAESTLRQAEYFTNKEFEEQRSEIMIHGDHSSRKVIEEAFKHQFIYAGAYQSTVNRLVRLYQDTLGLMFSVHKGINFTKLVAEDWIILVNLDTGAGLDILSARLLGVYVLNAIQTAKERLNKKVDNDPKKIRPFYIYVDEAGEFANRKVARTLSLKQKTGIRMTLAHQYKSQFEDEYVWDAVLQNCKLTAMFYTRSKEDRDLISKQFYHGEIDPFSASDANADLPKQYAVIKPMKGNAARVRIPDVEPAPVTKEQLHQYICSLYEEQDWYYDVKELKKKIDESTRKEGTDTQSTRPRTPPDSPSSGKARVPKRKDNSGKWKDVS